MGLGSHVVARERKYSFITVGIMCLPDKVLDIAGAVSCLLHENLVNGLSTCIYW